MNIRTALFALAALACAGCATIDVGKYAAEGPSLDLARYFTGTVDGWGMFQDRSGKIVKRFRVRIDCTWKDDEGTLDEHFEFADGTTQNRIWRLVRHGYRYAGTAADVVGTAQGLAAGNVLHWTYVLALPVDGMVWNVDMDDWMVLIDDTTMLNRTAMSKFGINVGEATLSFRRQ